VWWFDGDRAAARRAFEGRGTVGVAAFERQIACIAAEWSGIAATFQQNIIHVLDSHEQHLAPEEILPRMSRPGGA